MPRLKKMSVRKRMVAERMAKRGLRNSTCGEAKARRRIQDREYQRRSREGLPDDEHQAIQSQNKERQHSARRKHKLTLEQVEIPYYGARKLPVYEALASREAAVKRTDAISRAVTEGFYDSNISRSFRELLHDHIKVLRLKLNNIYWVNQCGLYWKALPEQVHTSIEKPDAKSFSRERMTMLICANVTATHKLPILVVGKGMLPNASFRGIFSYETNAQLNSDLFLCWYRDSFIPTVLERQHTDGEPGRVLLIIDGTPPGALSMYPSEDDLNSLHSMFHVLCSSEPMSVVSHRGATEMKTYYRRLLLQRLSVATDSEHALRIGDSLTLLESCSMVENAWESISSNFLSSGWRWLWSDENEVEGIDSSTNKVDGILNSLRMIPGCDRCSESDLRNWLDVDQFDCGHAWRTVEAPSVRLSAVGDGTAVYKMPLNVKIEPREDSSSVLNNFGEIYVKAEPQICLETVETQDCNCSVLCDDEAALADSQYIRDKVPHQEAMNLMEIELQTSKEELYFNDRICGSHSTGQILNETPLLPVAENHSFLAAGPEIRYEITNSLTQEKFDSLKDNGCVPFFPQHLNVGNGTSPMSSLDIFSGGAPSNMGNADQHFLHTGNRYSRLPYPLPLPSFSREVAAKIAEGKHALVMLKIKAEAANHLLNITDGNPNKLYMPYAQALSEVYPFLREESTEIPWSGFASKLSQYVRDQRLRMKVKEGAMGIQTKSGSFSCTLQNSSSDYVILEGLNSNQERDGEYSMDPSVMVQTASVNDKSHGVSMQMIGRQKKISRLPYPIPLPTFSRDVAIKIAEGKHSLVMLKIKAEAANHLLNITDGNPNKLYMPYARALTEAYSFLRKETGQTPWSGFAAKLSQYVRDQRSSMKAKEEGLLKGGITARKHSTAPLDLSLTVVDSGTVNSINMQHVLDTHKLL